MRGNQHDKGAEVTRRFLSALPGPEAFRSGSGRLELARLIASADNSLTARVMVNRIWGHLFGKGIVRTPSDFGVRGERPTHPELLDYLTSEFVASGWSVKDLIQRVVLSRAYRQSSSDSEAGAAKDPTNRVLWRRNRTRLDFEALRDSMLAVGGKLDTKMGGAPFDLKARLSSSRRTLYAYVSGEHPSQLMRTFDSSNPEEHTPRRQLTTVPQQALFLMNSPFLAEQARAVAASCGDAALCVDSIHRKVLGRYPDPRERSEAMDFVRGAGEVDPKPAAQAASEGPCRHGTARIDPRTGSVSDFRRIEYRVEDRLQPLPMLPSPAFGRASLTPRGGFPGDGTDYAVVRRWEAPRAIPVGISGTLSHAMSEQALRFDYSNGVRGWIVSSRRGIVASWIVRGYEAEAVVKNLEVHESEHLDFVVDSLGDYASDSFRWATRFDEVLPADQQRAGMEPQTWSAEEDFDGPRGVPLGLLEQYAQVLLMTNEFAFRD